VTDRKEGTHGEDISRRTLEEESRQEGGEAVAYRGGTEEGCEAAEHRQDGQKSGQAVEHRQVREEKGEP
jgi:hypothetical protein